MPYGDAYTHAPLDGYGEPYMYVYYPAYGWTWLAAPWVWGWGPRPFFGVHGPWRFAWFGRGWWRNPGRSHFAPARFRSGFGFHGARPGPFRGGSFSWRGPAVRGGFGGHGGGHLGRGHR